ncbi:hypothetical protein Kisp02_62860 [Kineosporia sp. NBRC 101731]|nr:hypothetical protein Kisp02_62860 [Kineosporia sp. NBRC 101731]
MTSGISASAVTSPARASTRNTLPERSHETLLRTALTAFPFLQSIETLTLGQISGMVDAGHDEGAPVTGRSAPGAQSSERQSSERQSSEKQSYARTGPTA